MSNGVGVPEVLEELRIDVDGENNPEPFQAVTPTKGTSPWRVFPVYIVLGLFIVSFVHYPTPSV